MLVHNSVVTLSWELKKTPNWATYNENYFDLQITAPSGAVTYLEGSSNWATVFVQPGTATNGSILHNIQLLELGVYVFILCNGVSTAFDIINTSLGLVVEQESWQYNVVHLP